MGVGRLKPAAKVNEKPKSLLEVWIETRKTKEESETDQSYLAPQGEECCGEEESDNSEPCYLVFHSSGLSGADPILDKGHSCPKW